MEEHGRPTVAVVSGDLTYSSRPSGFAAFEKLLIERTDVLPPDRRNIVVVPGNHDVVWDEEPGSEARYAGFLKVTRELECTTPLMDGVDFDRDDGAFKPVAEKYPHHVEDEDLVVVPINSSNYCGVLADARGGYTAEEWAQALEPLEQKQREQALAAVKKLSQRDMARVSTQQIAALRSCLNTSA